MKEGYHIRVMNLEEVEDIAIEWAAREGWNPGLNDAECFYAADPDGFMIGLLNDKIVGCVSATKYSDDYAFSGFYIVGPEYRGHGYGIQLSEAVMQRLAGCNIGLDGVVEQQETYKKIGFKYAYRNIRFEGISTKHTTTSVHVVSAADVSLDSLAKYDRQFFPADRENFLKQWIHQEGGYALVYKIDREIHGFGVIRPCVNGYKIGPLYGNTLEVAELLLKHLSGRIPEGSQYYLDIPEPNENAILLAEKYKMTKVFETARMYSKSEPYIPMEKYYGVTSFELG
jgi:GNAT superfamily N-acetyltransferase